MKGTHNKQVRTTETNESYDFNKEDLETLLKVGSEIS